MDEHRFALTLVQRGIVGEVTQVSTRKKKKTQPITNTAQLLCWPLVRSVQTISGPFQGFTVKLTVFLATSTQIIYLK